MSRRFCPSCLMLLCALTAPGAITAEAAGIPFEGHAQNIPRAVAGVHNPRSGAGAQPPSRLNPNTRNIQRDTAGETAATRSLK